MDGIPVSMSALVNAIQVIMDKVAKLQHNYALVPFSFPLGGVTYISGGCALIYPNGSWKRSSCSNTQFAICNNNS